MGSSTSHDLEDVSAFGLFRYAQSSNMLPDISIDTTLMKYSGPNSTAELQSYFDSLQAVSTASDAAEKLGSIIISYSGVGNCVGLGALVISFVLDLAVESIATQRSDSTLNMMRRVFAEEKASDVRDTMTESVKRLAMHLRDPAQAIEDTTRLERKLSEELTRLRNSMLYDNQMSSRAMKQWVNGAAFHSQMLVHEARLKTTNTSSSDIGNYLISIGAVVDLYRNDLHDLLKRYEAYKRHTITMTSPIRPCVKYGCSSEECVLKDEETTSLKFHYKTSPYVKTCYGLYHDYMDYMFANWSPFKELNKYFTDLKNNLKELISQHDKFNITDTGKLNSGLLCLIYCQLLIFKHEQCQNLCI